MAGGHVIGTAGHVDHGKSALVQRLTGIDPDRFAEEKRRGLTIDLGFAWLRLPSGIDVGIVDVPGHERFVRNMLAGAGGVTSCLFVVAANEGWMPQSAEHLAIVDLLDISGVVAVTKADLVNEDELAAIRDQIRARVAGTTFADAPIVPCSATTGHGMDDLIATLDELARSTPGAVDRRRPRLWVDRVFTIAGAGTVVTGTLSGGSFAVGDTIEIAPHGRVARIRGIQNHKHAVDSIGPGNRVALNLAGLDKHVVARGDAVIERGAWRATRRIDVRLEVLDEEGSSKTPPIGARGAYTVHTGATETPLRVKTIGRDALRPGDSGFARLHLDHALPLERGDRFVLRDVGRRRIVGGGVVLDPWPSPRRKTPDHHAAILARLNDTTADAALEVLLEDEGEIGITEARLRTGTDDIDGATRLGHVLVSPARLEDLLHELRSALAAYHAEHPLEHGYPREALRAALDLAPEAFEALLHVADDVERDANVVRSRAHRVELDPATAAAKKRLVDALEAGGLSPPLTKELNGDGALIRSLLVSGELVRIGDFMLTARRAAEVRRLVRARIEEVGPVTVAEIRDLLGTTRKYTVPLCEWLDQTGATLRRGNVRILGPTP